ncbi:hypothetical protein DERP_004582 [Dermatophagoides pteronyssinus]|uniref:Uncharacterized protein n=1 Tax=Dermatophagoides pteronyssinus TaxID=6956 RepID=A0ABQ8JPR1_DERPT|nr:hypothetical protein DERP_004582 [Dermatophagoides pteronyssinus]
MVDDIYSVSIVLIFDLPNELISIVLMQLEWMVKLINNLYQFISLPPSPPPAVASLFVTKEKFR